MEKNLQKYSLLAKTVSALAVIISMIFVGFEVRESAKQTALNSQSIQVNTYQDLIAQIINLNKLTLQIPDVGATDDVAMYLGEFDLYILEDINREDRCTESNKEYLPPTHS